jgi:hypothetical protein
LTEISIASADHLSAGTISAIFAAATLQVHQKTCAPFWIEASRDPNNLVWDDARRELLMRMNERRTRFENEVKCPMILVLPAGFQRDTASSAPDLWHVRIYSSAIESPPSQSASTPTSAVAIEAFDTPVFSRRQRQTSIASGEGGGGPVSASASDAIDYFRVNQRLSTPPETGPLAKVPGSLGLGRAKSQQPIREFSLADGWAATDAALGQRALDDAMEIAAQTLAAARLRTGPQAQRDLSVSLNNVGDVANQQGRLDAAATYEESLGICRLLLKTYGDGPQALEDLASALERLAEVGAPEQAHAAWTEAYAVMHRLALVFQNDSRKSALVSRMARLKGKLGDANTTS